MTPPLESKVQADLIQHLHSTNWFVTKVNLASVAGFPDLIAIKDGRTVFIEVKRPGGSPRKLQEVCHRKLKEHGAEVFVYDGTIDFEELCSKTNS